MESGSHLAYVGHATVLVEMDGIRILTDPALRRRVGPLRRQVDVPDSSVQHVDAVLISHTHWDHLDLPSLRSLKGGPQLIVPRGAANYLQDRGFHHVKEIEPGEKIGIAGVAVEATLANHSGFGPPIGSTAVSLGFMIHGTYRIYFAGDTDPFPGMQTLHQDLDIALLPVWGWGPALGTGHLDPFLAAQMLTHLRPRVAIPIHWGTYCPIGMCRLRPGFLSRPPRDFAAYAAAQAPGVEVCVLEPGESFYLGNRIKIKSEDA